MDGHNGLHVLSDSLLGMPPRSMRVIATSQPVTNENGLPTALSTGVVDNLLNRRVRSGFKVV